MAYGDIRYPAGVFGNREFSNNVDHALTADKQWHKYRETEDFNLNIGDTPTTKEVLLFQANKAGKLDDDIFASLNDSGTNTSITFDVKKNGTTVLSAPISVVHGDGDRGVKTGTFASEAARTYARGDVFSCLMTVTSSTGAQGPMLTYERLEQSD